MNKVTKKSMRTLISIITILTLMTGCTKGNESKITPDSQQNQGTEIPYSNGPTKDIKSIKGPDSPPPTITNEPKEEAEKIKLTHQVVETSYKDSKGTHKIKLTFNIDEDKIKGIMLQPAFKDKEERSHSKFLSEQIVFKNLEEIDIKPDPETPEFSKAYIEAFHQAVKMYKEKNKK